MHRFYYPRLVLIILNFFLFTFLPALCVEEKAADSLDVTLGEQAVDETLCCPEVRGAEFIHRKYQNNPELQFYDRLQARDGSAVREQVFSSSDHSDIVTLRDLKEDEHAEEEELEEAGSTEENYLGTSSSSHYTFTAAETGKTHCTPRCFLQQNNLNPSSTVDSNDSNTKCSSSGAGLLLSRWKLQQTLVNLSHRLRSRLPGSGSFLDLNQNECNVMQTLFSSIPN